MLGGKKSGNEEEEDDSSAQSAIMDTTLPARVEFLATMLT